MSYDNVKSLARPHFSVVKNGGVTDRSKQAFAITLQWGEDKALTIPQSSREEMRETVVYLRDKLGPLCDVIGWRGSQPIDMIV
jgi:hypothetical protein